jgi:signal transduction histidine kinase
MLSPSLCGSIPQRLLRIFLLAWAIFSGTCVWAQDHVLEKSYWTDTTGTASFQQAQSANYTPYTGVLSKGYSPYVQWVRLTIKGVPASVSSSLVLRIRPVYLDRIELFDPIDPTHVNTVRITGDLSSWQSTEFESLHHTFQIPTHPEAREIWLRLSTDSTQLLHVEALTPREMLHEEHGLWLIYSALLALILTFLVWVFLAWLRDRDPVNGFFVLRQFVLLLYTASYLGYHRILLADVVPAESQNFFYNSLVLLTSALSIIFEYRFLKEYVMPRWGHWLFCTLLVTSLVAITLLMIGQTRQAVTVNMILNAAALITMLLVATRIRLNETAKALASIYQLPKPVVISYYLVLIAVLALSILPSLGVLQGSMLAIYGVLMYGLISGLFMTALLIVRSRQLERIRTEAANSLFLSREQLAIEQQRRQDQTQLLSMLMHELKTPLSVIDMAMAKRSNDDKASGYVERAIENMKAILDHCVQTDRMIDGGFQVKRQPVNLAHQISKLVSERKEGPEHFTLDLQADSQVDTDLHCFQIIVKNLIENAFKHGDRDGLLNITLATSHLENGNAGFIASFSNLPGPSAWPDEAKLFTKYYRSAYAQRQSGTGLGLYLSSKLAEQLGGALRYRADHKKIIFELWLPS